MVLWRPYTSRGSEEPPGGLSRLTLLGAGGRWPWTLPWEQRAALLCFSDASSLSSLGRWESRLQTQEKLWPCQALRAVCPGVHPSLLLRLRHRYLMNGVTRLISMDVV